MIRTRAGDVPSAEAEPPNDPSIEAEAPRPTPVRYVFRHLARFRGAFAAALVWSVVFVVVPMQVPLLAGMLVNGLLGLPASFYGVYSVSGAGAIFWFAVIGLGIVAGAYGLAAYWSSYSVAELGRTFVREQQKELIAKLDHSSIAFHHRLGPGELLSRVVTDTESTRTFVTQVFFNTVQNVARVVYPVAALAFLDPQVALVTTAILPVQWVVSRRLQAGLRDASRQARTTRGRLSGAVQENLQGIETIQTSRAESSAVARVAEEADRLAADQIRVRSYYGLINGTTWALTSVGIALAWGVGGWQVLHGGLSVGVLVAVTGYVAFLYLPMQRFTSVANTYQTGMVAFERIREVLESSPEIADDPSLPGLRITSGEIEFRDVSFGYGPAPSLERVNLTVHGGRVTAVLGRNGSGKSTLLKLIDRLYDLSAGAIRIDGQDLRSVRLHSLRSQVGVVPQSPMIFAGTVAENIRFGRPQASSAEVEWAARAAGAHASIARLPEGYGTRVGAGGLRLSGGEVQRIAIARALLRRPRILLLDEPNSALDPESEALLFAQLARLRGAVTVVIVAHHLDRVLAAVDEVVVMDGGRPVEPGSEPPIVGRAALPHRPAPSREVPVA